MTGSAAGLERCGFLADALFLLFSVLRPPVHSLSRRLSPFRRHSHTLVITARSCYGVDFHWGQKQTSQNSQRSFHDFRFSPVSCSFELGAEERLPFRATVAACCLLPSRIKHGNIPQQTTDNTTATQNSTRVAIHAHTRTHTHRHLTPVAKTFPNMLPSLLLPVGSAVLAASSVLAAKCGRGSSCSEDEPCCSRESPAYYSLRPISSPQTHR